MQYLSFSNSVIPGLAISMDILFYWVVMRKTTQKKIFKQFVLKIILFAFLFNLAWEILQVPLFKDGTYSWSHIVFCVLASVADVIMVLLVYFGFAIIYKNTFWIQNLNLCRITFLLLTGGIGAVLAEAWYLSSSTWTYADAMPVIPILNAGLSPVLQFMTLPLLVYILSFQIVKQHYRT